MAKATTFYIKCSEEEAAAIRSAAKKRQRTIHNYLRTLVLLPIANMGKGALLSGVEISENSKNCCHQYRLPDIYFVTPTETVPDQWVLECFLCGKAQPFRITHDHKLEKV